MSVFSYFSSTNLFKSSLKLVLIGMKCFCFFVCFVVVVVVVVVFLSESMLVVQ